ncbi:hypothetical protein BV25DRAFT_1879441 [Artomyces pyxidatus]|uniref:Uncharacterized protein n=1 Tax=Artomyces pyxidatus TaxID=48021 RepID=A0ACB8TBK1_9AGAM|nr:hypothetical protein BV25DRAFT_1879441 [Artomyces pyxidatus]
MGTASRKRTRASEANKIKEEPAQDVQPLRHHPRLWYDDGNVVLSCGSVAFKVHRSVLSRESTVLDDILAAGSERLEEGCPVYVLLDDSDQVAQMLECFYGFNLSYSDVKQLPFALVRALYRMGTKYDIQRLREDAVTRLRICYPETFEKWMRSPDPDDDNRPIAWSDGQDYAVLQLASESTTDDLYSILPVAFYECCSKSSAEEVAKLAERANAEGVEIWERHWEISRRLLVGMGRLEKSRREDTFCFLDGRNSPACVDPGRCKTALKDAAHSTRESPTILYDNRLSLDHMGELINKKMQKTICSECLSFVKKRHGEGRERAFDRLTEIFDLPISFENGPDA